MTIEELAKRHAKDIPNSRLVKYYEAAIPQYCMEVILTMEKEKPLSVLQEFVLKFVNEGIDEVGVICRFLGINMTAVHKAIADLQTPELIRVDILNSKIKLTDKGKEALKNVKTIIPEDVEYKIFMDGFTGYIYLDNLKKYQRKELRNFELMPVTPNVETPKLQDVSYEDVKNAIIRFRKDNVFAKDRLEGNLLSIPSLEKVYTEYNKVSVLIYVNKSEDIELRVFEKQTRRKDYENILYQMYSKNTRVFEFDKKNDSDDTVELPLLSIIPTEVKDDAKAFTIRSVEIDKEITQLQTQLTVYMDDADSNDNEDGQQIAELKKRIIIMEEERKSANRLLSTYDHRPLLIRALTEAQNSVVIISPWIKNSGLNNEILRLVEKAIQRGVKVIIGYGISEQEDSDKWIISKLNELSIKRNIGILKLIALNNTHEKVLLMDNKFLVVTSFNWLSFKGDPNKGFRQETGIYTESQESIQAMKADLSRDDRLGVTL